MDCDNIATVQLTQPYPDYSCHEEEQRASSSPTVVAESYSPQIYLEDRSAELPLYQSTIFHSNAALDTCPPDTLLVSADRTGFQVHGSRLLKASKNMFAGICEHKFADLPTFRVIPVADDATVLSIVLSIAYDLPPDIEHAPFETLCRAVAALAKYALVRAHLLAPNSPFSDRLLTYASIHPIELYALAAERGAEALAVSASAYLASYPLTQLSDALAARMGVLYLMRLFELQDRRRAALRVLIFTPPPLELTAGCGLPDQRRVLRAWSRAVARLAPSAAPDLPVRLLQHHLDMAISDEPLCVRCSAAARRHAQYVVREWCILDRTIRTN